MTIGCHPHAGIGMALRWLSYDFLVGVLVPILETYCPRFAGFYLYYPGRRNLAPKLLALVDHLQRFR